MRLKDKCYLFVLLLSVMLLSSCANQGATVTPGQTSQNGNNANGSTMAAKDLCVLLPVSEVSQLAGVTFTTTEHKVNNKRTPTLTDCFYKNTDGQSVAIIANYDNGSLTAKKAYQDLLDYQAKQEDEFPSEKITGVGEDAFMPLTGKLTQINALDKNVWISLSIYLDGDADAQKNKAVSIGKKVFEVL
jgi:hypothetical protein